MSKASYLPSQDAKFDDFQDDFVITVNANHVAWGISAGEVTALTTAQTPWASAWAVAKNKDNRTSAQVTAKKLARKDYSSVLRPFIQTRIYGNPLMTDTDRQLCGLKPRDKVRTRIPAPTGTPAISLVPGTGNSMLMYFSPPPGDAGSKQRGKPKGVTALLMVSQKGGTTPPVNPDSCNERILLSRSPKRFTFDPDQVGQRVYFFACWVNAKGEQGPWTDLQSFIIS